MYTNVVVVMKVEENTSDNVSEYYTLSDGWFKV